MTVPSLHSQFVVEIELDTFGVLIFIQHRGAATAGVIWCPHFVSRVKIQVNGSSQFSCSVEERKVWLPFFQLCHCPPQVMVWICGALYLWLL